MASAQAILNALRLMPEGGIPTANLANQLDAIGFTNTVMPETNLVSLLVSSEIIPTTDPVALSAAAYLIQRGGIRQIEVANALSMTPGS